MEPDIKTVTRLALELAAGSAEKADALLDLPQPTFGGKTLRQLVEQGRAQTAVDYLESISSGFVG